MSNEQTPAPRAYVGRRLVGLSIDWLLSLLISAAFFPGPGFDPDAATVVERVLLVGHPMATLAIFALQHVVLVATLGTTIGHRLVQVRVVREDGAPFVGLVKAVVRTLLLVLVIPAVVWDTDNRGLHDIAASTSIVSTRKSAAAD